MDSSPVKDVKDARRCFVELARSFLCTDYLPKLERCLEQLNDEQIWWRPNEESNSIGNLLLHLCGNARQWIVSGLGGAADARVRQQEFDQRDIIGRGDLMLRLRATLGDVDSVLRDFDSDRLLEVHSIQGKDVTALEAIFHVTEHFSMHTGQIILLTKLLTARDLHFYDFEGDAPLQRWLPDASRES